MLLAACGDEATEPAPARPDKNPIELTLRSTAQPAGIPVTPVAAVDLGRYLGLWYEVARIPAWFQGFCRTGTTAHYSLRADGNLRVENTCNNQFAKSVNQIGVAGIPDKAKSAELMVSFLSENPAEFGAEYWVIKLADDYRYAVVGHPTREYGWVLSRTPTFTQADLDAVADELVRQGYDLEDWELTDQGPNLGKNP
jgi:apolipoprotein D and lipocalin family protein